MAGGCARKPEEKPLAAAAAAPAPEPGRKIGPNEKINVAVVGVGGRGSSLLRQVLGMQDQCTVVAVCDVYQRRINAAVEECKKRGVEATEETVDRIFSAAKKSGATLTDEDVWRVAGLRR